MHRRAYDISAVHENFPTHGPQSPVRSATFALRFRLTDENCSIRVACERCDSSLNSGHRHCSLSCALSLSFVGTPACRIEPAHYVGRQSKVIWPVRSCRLPVTAPPVVHKTNRSSASILRGPFFRLFLYLGGFMRHHPTTSAYGGTKRGFHPIVIAGHDRAFPNARNASAIAADSGVPLQP